MPPVYCHRRAIRSLPDTTPSVRPRTFWHLVGGEPSITAQIEDATLANEVRAALSERQISLVGAGRHEYRYVLHDGWWQRVEPHVAVRNFWVRLNEDFFRFNNGFERTPAGHSLDEAVRAYVRNRPRFGSARDTCVPLLVCVSTGVNAGGPQTGRTYDWLNCEVEGDVFRTDWIVLPQRVERPR